MHHASLAAALAVAAVLARFVGFFFFFVFAADHRCSPPAAATSQLQLQPAQQHSRQTREEACAGYTALGVRALLDVACPLPHRTAACAMHPRVLCCCNASRLVRPLCADSLLRSGGRSHRCWVCRSQLHRSSARSLPPSPFRSSAMSSAPAKRQKVMTQPIVRAHSAHGRRAEPMQIQTRRRCQSPQRMADRFSAKDHCLTFSACLLS